MNCISLNSHLPVVSFLLHLSPPSQPYFFLLFKSKFLWYFLLVKVSLYQHADSSKVKGPDSFIIMFPAVLALNCSINICRKRVRFSPPSIGRRISCVGSQEPLTWVPLTEPLLCVFGMLLLLPVALVGLLRV